MVIDELIVRDGITNLPIDSYDGQMIEEIIIEEETFHFAKQKDLTGTSEIVADNGVAEPIRILSVSGATSQIGTPTPETPIPIENANNEGMSITLHGDNLLNKEKFLLGALKNETEFSVYGASVLSNTNVNAMLKPNTKYTLSYEVEGVVGMPDGATVVKGQGFSFVNNSNQSQYFATMGRKIANEGEIYTYSTTFTTPSTLYEDLYVLYLYSGRYSLNGVNTLATCIIRNVQIVEGTEPKPYEPYFREEIAIPTSVEVEGDTVPLLMSKWDKLTVDRLNNKVIYTEGSWQRAITGKENWFQSWGAYNNGYGEFYCLKISPYRNGTLRDNEGYSNYFPRTRWVDSAPKNSFLASHSDGDLILFCTDKTTKVADIKIWLQERYAEGNPVVFLVRRYTYLEHDITNTELGQSLLALATGKGTNYLEITGALPVSQTDLSYWEQIVPVTT